MMMLTTIDEHHGGTCDFFYLPIDFKNKCNVGYAFINMLSLSHVIPFYEAEMVGEVSEKVAFLAYARIQGKTTLVAHFQNSSLMNKDKRCGPILFNSEGSGSDDQIIQEHLPSSGLNIQVSQPNGSSPENSSGSMTEDRSGDEVEKGEQWQWKQNVPSKQEHATPLTVPCIWCTENR
ncbi:Protein MEI2-like 1 [Forsythia ovata]|uniref:Protein MEI2-like 1 n=1 Tax=Forsythia ovata TaxID=205694 RepID=A0ABD1QC08_9LAMI